MSRSAFNFQLFREAIIRIAEALAKYHNTPISHRSRFREITEKGVDANIFCLSPYSHIQASIKWEVRTKSEWTKNGYIVYIKLEQTIHRDGEPFIESRLIPEFGIVNIQTWLGQEKIKIYYLPEARSDNLNITLVFYIKPHG